LIIFLDSGEFSRSEGCCWNISMGSWIRRNSWRDQDILPVIQHENIFFLEILVFIIKSLKIWKQSDPSEALITTKLQENRFG
jgi:hypothetical protein